MVIQLSAVCGGDMSEFRTVDKYLADGDLRRRAAGRQRLDATRREALRLLLGVMGAPVKSRPVQYVKDVQKFGLSYVDADDAKVVKRALGMTPDEMRNTDLLDVLDNLSLLLADRRSGSSHAAEFGPRVWLEVEQGGHVSIQFDGDEGRGEAIFIGAVDFVSTDLKRTATVSDVTLAWIGANGVAD
ncbi:hypothetical protein [Roseovarius sp.]|uniref:hypothetical protein n=1 Tax=Roseovarius sp. TaxID=1486281 RepID=UPI0032EBE7E3